VNAREYPVSDSQQGFLRSVVRRQLEGQNQHIRVATVNIGTLTAKGREVAAMMKTRKLDILCLKETRWTGGKSKGKARNLGDECKLYYSGGVKPRNGVGICLNEYWQDKVIDVVRKLDRLITMKLVTSAKNYNIMSAYAPQQGCSEDEKNLFWNQLEDEISRIPDTKQLMLAGDLNGHIEQERNGYRMAWWQNNRTEKSGGRAHSGDC